MKAVPIAAATLFAGSMSLLLLGACSIVLWGEPPWRLMGMIAATWSGPDALAAGETIAPRVLLVAFFLHFALTALYALALSSVASELPRRLVPVAGVAFGALIYLANLHGFTIPFPWFEPMRSADTLLVHLLFGFWLSAGAVPDPAPRLALA